MRHSGILFVIGLIGAGAVIGGSPGGATPLVLPGSAAENNALIVQVAAKKSPAEQSRARNCKALNKCRWYYAHCENKVYGSMKPGAKRDAAKDACVNTYRSCIKKAFPNGGFTFERWFMPGACT